MVLIMAFVAILPRQGVKAQQDLKEMPTLEMENIEPVRMRQDTSMPKLDDEQREKEEREKKEQPDGKYENEDGNRTSDANAKFGTAVTAVALALVSNLY